MIIEEDLENKIPVKNILLNKIEKVRQELINMANSTNRDLNQTEVVQKSQELDQLINQYNAILN